MHRGSTGRRFFSAFGIIGSVVVIGIILWLDIATGVWQELVVLSGLAAGLVTFLLTALIVDRVVSRSNAKRWAPVTRLALTEFLHDLADEKRSEISIGQIVARQLPQLPEETTDAELPAQLQHLRKVIVSERKQLSASLSRWAQFLASSGDNEAVLRHVANIALELDLLRDQTLSFDELRTFEDSKSLNLLIEQCNGRFASLVNELEARLRISADTVVTDLEHHHVRDKQRR